MLRLICLAKQEPIEWFWWFGDGWKVNLTTRAAQNGRLTLPPFGCTILARQIHFTDLGYLLPSVVMIGVVVERSVWPKYAIGGCPRIGCSGTHT